MSVAVTERLENKIVILLLWEKNFSYVLFMWTGCMIVLFSVVFFLSFDCFPWLNKEIICCYAWTRWSSWSQCNPKGRTISKRTDPWAWEHRLTEGCHCLLWQGHSARTRPGKMMHERQHNVKITIKGTLENLVHYCLYQCPSVFRNHFIISELEFSD